MGNKEPERGLVRQSSVQEIALKEKGLLGSLECCGFTFENESRKFVGYVLTGMAFFGWLLMVIIKRMYPGIVKARNMADGQDKPYKTFLWGIPSFFVKEK